MQWCIGGDTRVYGVCQPLGFFWQRILTSAIINKRGTFRPFATLVCVYPPPFLAIHHCMYGTYMRLVMIASIPFNRLRHSEVHCWHRCWYVLCEMTFYYCCQAACCHRRLYFKLPSQWNTSTQYMSDGQFDSVNVTSVLLSIITALSVNICDYQPQHCIANTN